MNETYFCKGVTITLYAPDWAALHDAVWEGNDREF